MSGAIQSEGPVTLVSGAASGIGKQLALSLWARGHRLVLIDRNAEGLQAVCAAEGMTDGARLLQAPLDVRDAAGWQALVERAVAHFGRIDHALNVAGYLLPGYVDTMTPEQFDLHIDINVKGVMYATAALARQMRAQGSGHIVNVASIAGLSHVPGLSAYCASKHAVRGFSLSVAHELKPHGVHVTVLCPDAVETPMLTLQESYREAALTFGGRRALSVQEVERAVLEALRTRPLEVVLDVPWTGRAFLARLMNMYPSVAKFGLGAALAQGRRQQRRRGAGPA